MELKEFKPRSNQHQTHFEDLVLLGKDGIEELNDKIDKFVGQLNGKSTALNLTIKIDGSPAVQVCGKVEGYPEGCIGLKSLISNPQNAMSTEEEINEKYNGNMADKLKYCLMLSNCIPDGEIWQGDCLYTKDDLKEVEVEGVSYLTFQPNKIVYAINEANESYEKIKNSDFGICFHTRYIGGSQSFNIDLDQLKDVPQNFYIMTPNANIPSAAKDYAMEDISAEYVELKELENELLNNEHYEELCDNQFFMKYWNTYENSRLSDKKAVTLQVDNLYNDLKTYIEDKLTDELNKKMSRLTTNRGRDNAKSKYEDDILVMDTILEIDKDLITNMVKCLNKAAEIKMKIWDGLKKSKQDYSTFYRHSELGYIPADMEGIAMSDMDGNIVKIVDRSSFSNVNRDPSYLSGFIHEDITEDNEENIKEIGQFKAKQLLKKVNNLNKNDSADFTKLLGSKYLWFGLFKGNSLKALAVIKKENEGYYLNEIQAFESSGRYENKLLKYLTDKYPKFWLLVDTEPSDKLKNYYRKFNLKELKIENSIWNKPISLFLTYEAFNDRELKSKLKADYSKPGEDLYESCAAFDD